MESLPHNVHCTIEKRAFLPDGSLDEPGEKEESWHRLEPPAYASISGDGTRTVVDKRGWFFEPTAGDCQFYPHEQPWAGEKLPGDLQRFGPGLQSGEDGQVTDREGHEWNRRETLLNGRPVALFRREYVNELGSTDVTAWLELETGLPLRTERITRDPTSGEPQHVIHFEFEYDVELPAGIFDVQTQDESPEDVKHSLAPNVRRAIERVIALSNAAWGSGDVARFRAAWRFPEPTPSGLLDWGFWELALTEQANRAVWASAVRTIHISDHVPVGRIRFQAVQVPVPGVFWVRSRLQVEWQEWGVWVGDADYFVQEVSGDYRLVHWALPIEEIRSAIAARAVL